MRSFLLLITTVTLAGCGLPETDELPDMGDAGPWLPGDLPADLLPPPGVPVLTVGDLVPGQQATFSVTDAPAGATVMVLFSTSGTGNGPCLGIGVCVDLLAPSLLGQTVADGQGSATIQINLPTTVPLITLHTQAVTIDGAAGDKSNTDSTGLVPSHDVHVQPIWNAECTTCHGGFNPADGMNLGPATAYGNLVGVPSSDVPAMPRVDPGDTANSYLWHKLEGTQQQAGGSGSRMPKGPGNLSAADAAMVEDWILGGAHP